MLLILQSARDLANHKEGDFGEVNHLSAIMEFTEQGDPCRHMCA
jgi:hypothetical protein